MHLLVRSPRWIAPLSLMAALALGNSTQAQAEGASPCVTDSSARSDAPFERDGYAIVHSRNLYRFQRRPHARFPFGVEIVLKAPPGTTEADVYRALSRGPDARDDRSPAAVDGARIEVQRAGSRYVVRLTSRTRSEAIEIQHRTAALD